MKFSLNFTKYYFPTRHTVNPSQKDYLFISYPPICAMLDSLPCVSQHALQLQSVLCWSCWCWRKIRSRKRKDGPNHFTISSSNITSTQPHCTVLYLPRALHLYYYTITEMHLTALTVICSLSLIVIAFNNTLVLIWWCSILTSQCPYCWHDIISPLYL